MISKHAPVQITDSLLIPACSIIKIEHFAHSSNEDTPGNGICRVYYHDCFGVKNEDSTFSLDQLAKAWQRALR